MNPKPPPNYLPPSRPTVPDAALAKRMAAAAIRKAQASSRGLTR